MFLILAWIERMAQLRFALADQPMSDFRHVERAATGTMDILGEAPQLVRFEGASRGAVTTQTTPVGS